MKKQNQQHATNNPEQSTTREDQSLQSNPRKAATKLKTLNNNVEKMKNRFKALQVQDEYNRFKIFDHEKRLNYHSSVHQKLSKDREFLRKSIDKIYDTNELKNKANLVREQIRENIRQARKNLLDSRCDSSLQRSEQFKQDTMIIKQNKQKQLSLNQERKIDVLEQQKKMKEYLNQHYEQKSMRTKVSRIIDSSLLTKKAEDKQKQMFKLMQYQQQMLKRSSQSLMASHLMRHKFTEVFTTHTSRNVLPEIRSKTNQTILSSNSDLIIIG